ncbi:MAG: T9SS type A sorting domain-containing protein, partial [Aureispira sp.]|nr:T9SS type A sorting domain-containing protein [Aureispira sp.]
DISSLKGFKNCIVTNLSYASLRNKTSPQRRFKLYLKLLNDFSEVFNYLAKYDANGNYIWAKRIGKSGGSSFTPGSCQARSMDLDNNGNIYLTGYIIGTVDFDPSSNVANLVGTGQKDIFLAKYDANGNYTWAKMMDGPKDDRGNSLVVDGSGNIYLSGDLVSTLDIDPSSNTVNLTSTGSTDIFLAKYNTNGNYLWAQQIGGSNYDNSFIHSLAIDGNGNACITGYFEGSIDCNLSMASGSLNSTGLRDAFLAKYDANGNYIWAKNIGGSDADYGEAVSIDKHNNIYLTGSFSGTADLDPSSSTANLTSAGQRDIFVAKYDANGDYIWAEKFGSINTDSGNNIFVDDNGNIYLMGEFQGNVNFGGTSTLGSGSGGSNYVAKYDANMNYLWTKGIGVDAYDFGLDGNGGLFMTGSFVGLVDFDPSNSSNAYITNPGNDLGVFLAKYNETGAIAVNKLEVEEKTIDIYPNPSIGVFNISSELADFSYKVTTIDGKLVQQGQTEGNILNLNLSKQSNGLYYITVTQANQNNTFKIVLNK